MPPPQTDAGQTPCGGKKKCEFGTARTRDLQHVWPPAPSPVGVVELLHQPPAVCQSDLDVSDRLRGVEADRGAGLGLVGSLVLLGGGRRRDQLRGGAAGREEGSKKKVEGSNARTEEVR